MTNLANYTVTGKHDQTFIKGCTDVVNGRVGKSEPLVVAQFDSNFIDVVKSIGVTYGQRPTDFLFRFKAQEVGLGKLTNWFDADQFRLEGSARLPTSMTLCRSGSGNAKASEVIPLQQNPSPLMVIVDGIVDGDVDQPSVSILIEIVDAGLVFAALRYSISGISIASIVSGFNPRVSLKALIVKTTDIMEVKTHRLVGVFVEIGIKDRVNAQQGWAISIDDKLVGLC